MNQSGPYQTDTMVKDKNWMALYLNLDGLNQEEKALVSRAAGQDGTPEAELLLLKLLNDSEIAVQVSAMLELADESEAQEIRHLWSQLEQEQDWSRQAGLRRSLHQYRNLARQRLARQIEGKEERRTSDEL